MITTQDKQVAVRNSAQQELIKKKFLDYSLQLCEQVFVFSPGRVCYSETADIRRLGKILV